ncbi:MAG: tetratricopeptide repeat protein, partial [Saprospiraceae bacterium]|nr:tetratricopeptide repeat protein [Saprospiraceae bacterium]
MILRKTSLLLVFLVFGTYLLAQKSSVYTEALKNYKRGITFFEQNLFGKAQREFDEAVTLLRPIHEPSSDLLRAKAELNYARCAVRLEQVESERLFLDFIRSYDPDPMADQALVELANFYFDEREYDKAVSYFSRVPLASLPPNQRAEVKFKMGYSYFVDKNFSRAKANFSDVQDIKSDFYYPTNYYLGLCHFFEGTYDKAVQHFRVAEGSALYQRYIPYYIAQILFAEREFDQLIAYAEPKLEDSRLREKKEIHQLVGQAYFEKDNYQQALPHLTYYAENSGKLREEEWYQLGYAQYQTENYQEAIESFEELANANSRIGQNAMFYLANSYLEVGRKTSARTAMATAKRMNFDPEVTEDAIFNYAKLSYELNDPREAILALQDLKPGSPYYPEAQKLMSDIFLSYRDYQQAMEIIENMPEKTPQLLETYQKVAAYRGLQLLREEKYEEALNAFEQSLKYPIDSRTKAIATYWKGEIAHRRENYDESIRLMNQFMTLAKTVNNLPDESSLFTANYIQGYNYLKKDNYPAALEFFREAVDGIKRNRRFIRNENVKNQLLGDAITRTGDAYFKRNQYNDAVRFYEEAIENRYSGFIYAIYQKAILEGLRGRTTDKILALERIADEFPGSEYADDALLQLGSTYQEIGKLDQAAQPLKQLVRDYRRESNLVNQALIKLGLISYNQGNLQLAINYYKQIFNNNPTDEEAKLALAALEEIYVYDLGRPNDYFAFLETIPGYKLDNYERDSINFMAAETRFENGSYASAVGAYTNYINQFPQGRFLLPAHYHRGESHSVMEQYSEALRDYEWVVEQGQSKY